jgi:hypothetical protein
MNDVLTTHEQWMVASNLETVRKTGVTLQEQAAVLRANGYFRVADAVEAAEPSANTIGQRVRVLIDEQRTESWRPEYRANVSEEQGLGVLISRYFDWNGDRILKTAVAALEDANFHREAAAVQKLIDEVDEEDPDGSAG